MADKPQNPSHVLAHEIIATGLRALALKRHPDVEGGSNDAMRDLNAAVEWLRRLIHGAPLVGPPTVTMPQESPQRRTRADMYEDDQATFPGAGIHGGGA